MSRFLTYQEVVEINADTIRRHGGTHAIRDPAALESAVGRPQSGYYRDVIEEAAAFFESLSQNHHSSTATSELRSRRPPSSLF